MPGHFLGWGQHFSHPGSVIPAYQPKKGFLFWFVETTCHFTVNMHVCVCVGLNHEVHEQASALTPVLSLKALQQDALGGIQECNWAGDFHCHCSEISVCSVMVCGILTPVLRLPLSRGIGIVLQKFSLPQLLTMNIIEFPPELGTCPARFAGLLRG